MAPKKQSGRTTAKHQKQNDVNFNPNSVPSKDRVTFNIVQSDGFYKKFLALIYFLRMCVSYGIKRCCSSKWVSKDKCGEYYDYSDSKFLIIELGIDGQSEVHLLIYKPVIYMLAVGVGGKWWYVQDFTIHTGLLFPSGKKLVFESRYRKFRKKLNFQILCDSVKDIFNGTNCMDTKEFSFKCLCVFFCETTRFDELLFQIMKSQTESIFLNEFQTWVIRNWDTLSKLWILYDLGYEWNASELKELIIKTANAASEVLSVVMYVKNSNVLDAVKNIKKKMEEAEVEAEVEAKAKAKAKVQGQAEEEEEEEGKEKRLKRFRRRSYELNDFTNLEEMRSRIIFNRMSEENKANENSVKESVMQQYKFLDDMKNNFLKKRKAGSSEM